MFHDVAFFSAIILVFISGAMAIRVFLNMERDHQGWENYFKERDLNDELKTEINELKKRLGKYEDV